MERDDRLDSDAWRRHPCSVVDVMASDSLGGSDGKTGSTASDAFPLHELFTSWFSDDGDATHSIQATFAGGISVY